MGQQTTTTEEQKKTEPSASSQVAQTLLKREGVQILPKYDPSTASQHEQTCTVLYGYGIDPPDKKKYVDTYLFVGGVGRNIPRNVAESWVSGVRWQDGKPASSRIYPQAILPNDAGPAEFALATGITPLPPAELAAMIAATDAKKLVEVLGRAGAVALADALIQQVK
jgi:hypothetical protein